MSPLQYHFLPGNVLHPLKHELLLWASWRGQLLARTVRGLMSYRAALQALAAHENPHLMPPEAQQQFDRLQESTHALRNRQEQLQQQLRALQAADRDSQAGGQESTQGQQLQQQQQHRRQEAERVAGKLAGVARRLQADAAQLEPLQQQHQQWEALRGVLLDDLVDGKYHLVVSSQMFGVFASKESSSNMKARWLVHSIHMLRQKHPTLKVSKHSPCHASARLFSGRAQGVGKQEFAKPRNLQMCFSALGQLWLPTTIPTTRSQSLAARSGFLPGDSSPKDGRLLWSLSCLAGGLHRQAAARERQRPGAQGGAVQERVCPAGQHAAGEAGGCSWAAAAMRGLQVRVQHTREHNRAETCCSCCQQMLLEQDGGCWGTQSVAVPVFHGLPVPAHSHAAPVSA